MQHRTTTFRSWARTVLVAAAIVLLTTALASACPTCREGLAETDPAGQKVAAGFYYSILFMMSMPFIILTTFGSFAYRSVRKAQAGEGVASSVTKAAAKV